MARTASALPGDILTKYVMVIRNGLATPPRSIDQLKYMYAFELLLSSSCIFYKRKVVSLHFFFIAMQWIVLSSNMLVCTQIITKVNVYTNTLIYSQYKFTSLPTRVAKLPQILYYFTNIKPTCSSSVNGIVRNLNTFRPCHKFKRIFRKCECSKTTCEPYFLVPKLQWV